MALLIAHEFDAVKRHEWRILPLTSFLPDATAKTIFLWAHVPIAGLLLWIAVSGPDSPIGFGFSAFAIIHVGLHWLFRKHPKNEFNNGFSQALIVGAGLAGFAHLWAAF
ncbi:MAG: hypothetical protein GXP03_02775 [Alphaproteobacteria bacterium]|nr:hypothetical protein [Alphaproteobacteria bacterium]